jgi:lysophospholipase L1-like esterase
MPMKKLLLLMALSIVISSFSDTQITWVAIGDSITYLNEHLDASDYKDTKGYMTRVIEKLPNIHYINQGHNGWTAGDIADSIEQLGIQKASVYSIFLGSNDWWHGHQLGTMIDYEKNTGNHTFYGSFRTIINKIHSLNSAVKIILITPMQRTDFVNNEGMKNIIYGCYKAKNGQMLEQFAEAVCIIGKYEHCEVIDLYHVNELSLPFLVNFKRLRDPQTKVYKNYRYPDYINIPFDPASDEYPYPPEAINMTYDGLHPSDKGFTIIANLLIKIMSKY